MPPGGFPAPEGAPIYGSDGKKIIYDENGKPCRTCNTLANFRLAKFPGMGGLGGAAGGITGAAGAAAAVAPPAESADTTEPDDCPPDSEQLGRATWTFLHSVAATYPETPTSEQQQEMKTFISIFSKIYPCWYCAAGFQKYIKKNEPKVMTQEEFGHWLCDAHNAVNERISKPKFDCNLWKQRWKDGWEDGRCD